MEELFPLTAEERIEIDASLDKIYQRSNKRRTIEDLFFRWDRFITHIEGVYHFTIDDYTNDLCIRDFIQKLIDDCSIKLQDKILRVLAPMDDRYLDSTVSVEEPLLPSLDDEDQGWWWFRIPRKHSDRFYVL